MNWCISNSSYLVQNKPKLLQSENSYWLLSENLSWDASRIIFIVGTSPIVCDVGSSVSAFPADVLDQQAPLHPPIFCHHFLKLLSPTLPKLMNWILLSSLPLPSDPDNPQNLERALTHRTLTSNPPLTSCRKKLGPK